MFDGTGVSFDIFTHSTRPWFLIVQHRRVYYNLIVGRGGLYEKSCFDFDFAYVHSHPTVRGQPGAGKTR
jgi:hypothetical protein